MEPLPDIAAVCARHFGEAARGGAARVLSIRFEIGEARHLVHVALGLLLVALVVAFALTEAPVWFWAVTLVALVLGGLMIIPIGGDEIQQLSVVEKDAAGEVKTREIMPVRFTKLEVAV